MDGCSIYKPVHTKTHTHTHSIHMVIDNKQRITGVIDLAPVCHFFSKCDAQLIPATSGNHF